MRASTGVRFINPPWGGNDLRFNHAARIGGELHAIIKAKPAPFIVDRICGGAPYYVYAFDQKLLHAYVGLLGDAFLGLQIHETVCNVLNDWGRLSEKGKRFRNEPVVPDKLRSFFDWKSAPRWLEYGALDDYAGRTFPNSYMEAWREIMLGAKRQIARAHEVFAYCEAEGHGGLAFPHFFSLGARAGIAEVYGSQFMIAALRGAAKAAGKPWGISFAPWNGGVTCFVEPAAISWKCPLKELEQSNWPCGPDRGPSTALQRRTFFHAYLSGANTLHEEWGAENNLLDWDTGALSSYGQVTRELLDFQEKHQDIGAPYVPVALLLDVGVPPPIMFADAPFGGPVARWFKPRPIDIAWAQIKQGLYGLLVGAGHSEWTGLQEARFYPPCYYPELFDIIPSDASAETFANYRQIIAVGESDWPYNTERIPVENQFKTLAAALQRFSPFQRVSDLIMQVNYRETDKTWIVGLYNPRGARRGDAQNTGSILNPAFDVLETLLPKFKFNTARLLHGWPESTAMEVSGETLRIHVGAGGLAILEVRTA